MLMVVILVPGGCRDSLYTSTYSSSSFYHTEREAACIVSWQPLFLYSLSCHKAKYSSESWYKKHWELHKTKANFSVWLYHHVWAIWKYSSFFCSRYQCMPFIFLNLIIFLIFNIWKLLLNLLYTKAWQLAVMLPWKEKCLLTSSYVYYNPVLKLKIINAGTAMFTF